MRQLFTLSVALWLASAAAAGVRVVSEPRPSGPAIASESAGLFVGVREFAADGTLTTVQYAVDDAVDLAHLVSIELQPALVDPAAVTLALAGSPQKEDSRRKLEALKHAGATVEEARHETILKLLRRQANAVGGNGLLILSFSTHGINDGGTQHLLTASSLLQDPETSVTETKIRDIVSRAQVPRALILIDACREQLTKDIRAGNASPRSAATELLEDLGKIDGQVLLSAAAAGQYAYDDDTRRNGVFTAAVMNALRCRAATDEKGFVTVQTLSRYVEEDVLAWIQKHRDPEAKRATQISSEGRSMAMPLSVCISDTRRAKKPAMD